MQNIHPFVLGHVVSAALVGAVAGPLIESRAAIIVAAVLVGGAVASSLACRWWPGWDAAAWKLWPVAVLANPAMLATLGFLAADWQCVVGLRGGWNCLAAAVALVAAGFCLLPPVGGLLWRWRKRRSAPVA